MSPKKLLKPNINFANLAIRRKTLPKAFYLDKKNVKDLINVNFCNYSTIKRGNSNSEFSKSCDKYKKLMENISQMKNKEAATDFINKINASLPGLQKGSVFAAINRDNASMAAKEREKWMGQKYAGLTFATEYADVINQIHTRKKCAKIADGGNSKRNTMADAGRAEVHQLKLSLYGFKGIRRLQNSIRIKHD